MIESYIYIQYTLYTSRYSIHCSWLAEYCSKDGVSRCAHFRYRSNATKVGGGRRERRGKNFVVDNIGIIYTEWSGKIIKVGYAAKLLHDGRCIHPRDVHSITSSPPPPSTFLPFSIFFLSLQTFFLLSSPPLEENFVSSKLVERDESLARCWSKAGQKRKRKTGGGSRSVGRFWEGNREKLIRAANKNTFWGFVEVGGEEGVA